MAYTYTILNQDPNSLVGFDSVVADLSSTFGGTTTFRTSVAYTISVDFGVDYKILFQGSGFTYDGAGNPLTGTITSATLYLNIGGIDTPLTGYAFGTGIDQAGLNVALAAGIASLSTFLSTETATHNGSDGDDIIAGTIGNDIMIGGTGNDSYSVTELTDVIIEDLSGAAGGTDEVQFFGQSGTFVLGTNLENLTLRADISGTEQAINGTGNTQANVLTGNSASNILSGLNGNDTLDGGAGVDTLNGGAGNDSYIVDLVTDVVAESDANSVTGGVDTVIFTGQSGTFALNANVENLTLGSDFFGFSNAINGAGNELANVLTGNSASNLLSGAGGNDMLNGGGGLDTLIGGAGSDRYTVDEVADVITETDAVLATGGDDLVIFEGLSGTYTLSANVEKLTLSGSAATGGTGNNLGNTMTGNNGANTLSGLGGNDRLDGGLGIDTMLGGDGSDIYYANVFTDVIQETNANMVTGGNDLVYFTGTSGTLTLGANVERLTLLGTSAIGGTGNSLANTLKGNTAANTLSGLSGNDTIDGGLGRDTMIGGTGSDTYFADVFNDVIVETGILPASGGVDVVNFSGILGTFTLSANVENLNLTGVDDIGGVGNTSRNTIIGNTGSNEISGKEGNDILTGGSGLDAFIFDTALDAFTNVDVITDFVLADDTILLDNAIFTALGAATDTLSSAMFKNITIGALDASDRILYDDATGAIFYDADGSGAAFAAVQFATLTGSPTVTFDDFFVY